MVSITRKPFIYTRGHLFTLSSPMKPPDCLASGACLSVWQACWCAGRERRPVRDTRERAARAERREEREASKRTASQVFAGKNRRVTTKIRRKARIMFLDSLSSPITRISRSDLEREGEREREIECTDRFLLLPSFRLLRLVSLNGGRRSDPVAARTERSLGVHHLDLLSRFRSHGSVTCSQRSHQVAHGTGIEHFLTDRWQGVVI